MIWVFWLIVLGLGITIAVLLRMWKDKRRELEELEHRYLSLQHEKTVIFDFLHDLGEAFTDNIDRNQLLRIILRCAQQVCDAHGAAIYLWDGRRSQLKAEAVIGIFPPPFPVPDQVADKLATRTEYLENLLRNEPLKAESEALLARVARSGKPVLIADATGDERFPSFREEGLRIRTYLAVPLHYRDEQLGVIALSNREDEKAFSLADFEIVKSVADQAAYSLHHAQVYSQLADKKKMDHDLRMAREIQRILLPADSPKAEAYEFHAVNLPAQQVSGDYYDFIRVDDVRWGLVIADVSGKGIPASLIMAMCRSVLRSKAVGCPSPAQVLRGVNRQIYPDIREDMFITMVYLVYHAETHELRVARAGHESPLFARQNFELIESIRCPGMALGIDSGEVFDDVIEEVVYELQPRDTIIVYTDGINEALDEHGQEFGREHIKEALKTVGPQGVQALVTNIVERVQRFVGGEPQNDDITVAALQRRPTQQFPPG
jgi:sigma-B regulation protein RsbU (phosphoserine phosphatase)